MLHTDLFVLSWLSKKPANVEPGVGKWVSYLNRERKLDSVVGRRPSAPPAPKGLYLYGNVGSGMLRCFSLQWFLICRKKIVFHILYLLVTCMLYYVYFLLMMPYFICFLLLLPFNVFLCVFRLKAVIIW